MKYDYIEIGISNTENLCQKYPDGIGITIEPLKFYFDRIKTLTNHVKLNISISDDNGKVAIFYVDPISFHQENSSLDSKITYGVKNPPSDILQYLTNIGRLDLLKSTVVDCIDWDTLVSRHDISDIDILKLNISSQNVELITSILNSESQIKPKEIYLYYNTYFEKEAILHKLESSGYRIVNQKNDEIHVKKHMKIDKIIFASDDNPAYLSYWEINAKVCREILEIEPVLFWITDEDSDFYHDGHGLVKKIKRLPDYIEEVWGQTFHSSGFQAQNVRLWGTKFFPEEVCLTSDIDLILFNREYIDENVRFSDPEDMVIFNADGYDKIRPECVGPEFGPVRYPIPYISAKGKNFSKLLSCECSFKEYIQRLSLLNLGFGTDEFYMGMVVDNNKTDLVIHKNIRGASSYFYCNRRIERKHFRESVGNFSLDVLGYLDLTNYIDAHLPGPYEDYKEKVDNLLKYIFDRNSKNKRKRLFDYFDKAYCINLESRPDRLSHFRSEVLKYNLGDFDLVSGINGYDVYHNYPWVPEGPGSVGLLLTNLKILEDAKSKNYETIIIAEDDCSFTEDIENLEIYMQSLPDDWDMLYFGANHTDNEGFYHSPYYINNKVIRLKYSYCAHLVAIKRHMFDIIIQKINEIWKPIDVVYCDIQQKFKVYCFNPKLAVQYPNFSNIVNHEINYLNFFDTNKTTKYIINKINGRLGNCLFEIANAYALSLETGKKHVCDISDHIIDSLQLDYKNYTTNIFRNLEFDSVKFDYLTYHEKSYEYAPIDFCDNNLKLFGYFQSEKYFVKYREEILKLFEIDDTTKNYLLEKYSNSLEGDTCSIHVRRGDYLKYEYNHTILSIEYYIEACHLMGIQKKFLIFSDDIDWCKENFVFLPNAIFIENNKDFQDLYLMSMCKDHIIANSSFSWWGSWLNPHQDKKVIAPKKWFGPHNSHLDTKDLYSEGWIII